MSKIKIAGFTLAVACMLSAVVASSAFALESMWLHNSNPIGAAEKVAVDSSLSGLLLEDMGLKVRVLSEGELEGSVLAKGADEVTKINNIVSVFEENESGLCSLTVAPSVVPVNLPWKTQITLEAGVFWDTITGTGGEAGWATTCETGLGKMTDTCVTNTGRFKLTNGTENTVEAEADSNAIAKCTGVFGAGEGLVTSDLPLALILATDGLPLAVSEG